MTDWLVTHLPVLPVLLPSATAVVLLLLGDQGGDGQGRAALARQRVVAVVSALLGAAIAVALVTRAATGELMVYRLGDWPAPFGIVLVVDRLAALMVALTSALAVPVLLYAGGGWDARGRHFHAIFQFQLMGLNGAFVTGDLFNLFVFFEVLLIASYVLMMHGGGGPRLRVGLQYVVLNLAASALFLIGVSLVYAMTGTLNYADLALRVPQISGPDAAVLQAAALLLLVVFGFKAALAPLSLWLPATYAAAGAPVAALFAVMTKVGVYAIWRVHGVAFGEGAGASAQVAAPLLLPLALVTCAVGAVGALAAGSLGRLAAWLTVASVGTLLAALAVGGAAAWGAALYYLVHSTLVMAGLFLLAELIGAQRGAAADRLQPAAPVRQPALMGGMLLLAAAWAAGLPPLPGFLGKVAVLQAVAGHAHAALLWAVVLVVGFASLLGLTRAGIVLFWQARPAMGVTAEARAVAAGSAPDPTSGALPGAASPRLLAAALALLAAGVVLAAAASPIMAYTRAAATQLADTGAYARAVLGESGGAAARTTRPYSGERPVPAGAGSPLSAPSTSSGDRR